VQLRNATLDEIPAVQEVEVRAAVRFGGIPELAVFAEGAPADRETLEAAVADGRLFVAVEDARVVGFALVSAHEDGAHLDEIDVIPDAGGRGIGRALLDTAIAWARGCGHSRITLTTFRDVPWNGPFYARAGFVEVDEALTPRLAVIRARERGRGLDRLPRVAMARGLR
jgi:GNAT superfamily N-acetyltransferase